MEKKVSFEKNNEWVVIEQFSGFELGIQSQEVETNSVIWFDKQLPTRYLNKKTAARNFHI